LGIFSKKNIEQKSRYRQEHEYYCIDIFLTNILQLFDRIDPSPFREKDLDDDFVKYLTLCMCELRHANQVKLVIKMSEHNPKYLKNHDIEEAIENFFSFEIENTKNELALLFRQGRWALFNGIVFLVFCNIIVFFLSQNLTGVLVNTIKEGITVIGWVALWWPVNMFLYEWWPYLDKIKLYERLKKVKVEIITG
jgi:hypothetical protein